MIVFPPLIYIFSDIIAESLGSNPGRIFSVVLAGHLHKYGEVTELPNQEASVPVLNGVDITLA